MFSPQVSPAELIRRREWLLYVTEHCRFQHPQQPSGCDTWIITCNQADPMTMLKVDHSWSSAFKSSDANLITMHQFVHLDKILFIFFYFFLLMQHFISPFNYYYLHNTKIGRNRRHITWADMFPTNILSNQHIKILITAQHSVEWKWIYNLPKLCQKKTFHFMGT